MCWAACVCRPCGHTAGFENSRLRWGDGEMYEAKERVFVGWGAEEVGGGRGGSLVWSLSGSWLLEFPILGSCRGEKGHQEGAH